MMKEPNRESTEHKKKIKFVQKFWLAKNIEIC